MMRIKLDPPEEEGSKDRINEDTPASIITHATSN